MIDKFQSYFRINFKMYANFKFSAKNAGKSLINSKRSMLLQSFRISQKFLNNFALNINSHDDVIFDRITYLFKFGKHLLNTIILTHRLEEMTKDLFSIASYENNSAISFGVAFGYTMYVV